MKNQSYDALPRCGSRRLFFCAPEESLLVVCLERCHELVERLLVERIDDREGGRRGDVAVWRADALRGGGALGLLLKAVGDHVDDSSERGRAVRGGGW